CLRTTTDPNAAPTCNLGARRCTKAALAVRGSVISLRLEGIVAIARSPKPCVVPWRHDGAATSRTRTTPSRVVIEDPFASAETGDADNARTSAKTPPISALYLLKLLAIPINWSAADTT